MHKKHLLPSSVLMLCLLSPNAGADIINKEAGIETDGALALCPGGDTAAIKSTKPRAFTAENIGNTEISADTTRSDASGSTSLDGNVLIERHLLRVTADHAEYNKQQDQLRFSGDVHIDTETITLEADEGTVDMHSESEQDGTKGEFNNIRFLIPDSNMKGSANTIQTGDDKKSTLVEASITSCELSDPDWLISADEIRLDHADEYGTADDVVIRFKDIPILYTPYIEFPTSDKRRSGLLFPEIGTSSSRGVEIALPWYWNIAPNHDAVITPRNMVRRGTELGGKYRYLTRSTNGSLQGAYLPDDKITDEERYQVRYLQHTRIISNLLLDIDLQDISDSDYFNDFSNTLGSTSQTHLDRSARLNYALDNWKFNALIQDLKTIDESTPVSLRPYERLPQLTFSGDTEIARMPLLFTLDSEFVDFRHEDDTKVIGQRLTVRPGLRLPMNGAAWFVDPAIKFSHTQYDLDITSGTTQQVDDLDLPMSSIDAGLFFERDLDNGYQQTLEPRLYYLNVPFEDQSLIPVFDTSTPEFSISQLFRDNRFIGGDRIGDANQLTLALSSRIINPNTGNEFVRASIGQIYYFEDRKVSLSGNTVETAKQSDVIAELDTAWGRWQGNIDIEWDTSNSELSRENYFLHYRSDARHLFNIGYRKRLENSAIDIEQTDTSFVYAINREYSAYARWNYSLKENKDIDVIGGIAYDSCCWSIQLLAQRRLQNSSGTSLSDEYDNSLLVQFIFKGLGSISGNKTRSTLEQSIYGYTDTLQ